MRSEIFLLRKYGAKPDRAIKNYGGDEKFYLSCLQKFLNDPSFEKLELAVRGGSMKNADKIAAFIEEFSEILGLTEISEKTKKLRSSLSDGHLKKSIEDMTALLSEKDRLKNYLTIKKST